MEDKGKSIGVELALAELRSDELQAKLLVCYQCGTCTGGCPVAWVQPEYNPRRILEALRRGDGHELVSDQRIWLCAYCHACLERCPQRVEISQVIVRLKNISARTGAIPPDLMKELEAIERTGITVGQSSVTVRRRAELGLLPASPDASLAETGKIIAITAGSLLRQSKAAKGSSDV